MLLEYSAAMLGLTSGSTARKGTRFEPCAEVCVSQSKRWALTSWATRTRTRGSEERMQRGRAKMTRTSRQGCQCAKRCRTAVTLTAHVRPRDPTAQQTGV